MKRFILVLTLVALATPGLAQQDFDTGEVVLGAVTTNPSNNSSKFLEYRDIPESGVVPFLRFQGKNGDFRYDVWGRDVSQGDQRYGVLAENGTVRFEGSYIAIPHNFGNGGNSLLRPTAEDAYLLSDTLQQAHQSALEAGLPGGVNYGSLLELVTPSLAASPSNIDLKLSRRRGQLAFSLAPADAPYDLKVSYMREHRSGTRAANGTSFGFSNVLETPEPLSYVTQDLGFDASVSGSWGVARAAIHLNDFANSFASFVWDNPFRAVDSTDGRAYLSPGGASLNGPRSGQMALPPDNDAFSGSLGATLKFGRHTRLTADVALGRWRQNSTPLIGYTVNTAVMLPDGADATTAPTPINALDGQIDTTSINAFFTTKVAENLRLNARFRRYDNDNKTPQTRFEDGYVRFDAVWEDIPRITVPYGFTRSLLDATATYDFGAVSLEGGYKYTKMDRTFRETHETTENGVRLAADLRTADWVVVRGIYELASRDYDMYDGIHAEHASFLDAGPPANQPTLRRYDQAKRDLQRFGGTLQLTPGGTTGIFISYIATKQEFDDSPVPFEVEEGSETPLGLLKSDYATFTMEADYTPSDRASVYGFYSREDIDQFQTGRQSGGSLTFDPAWGWTATIADKVDSFGAGGSFALKPDKWHLDVFARWQKVDGDNSFTSGERHDPEDIPLFDDTELLHVRAELSYEITAAWTAKAGGFYEDYMIEDAQTTGTLNYMPGSFFLAANNGDYDAWVGWLSLTRRW